jgi:transcriptional regulator of acetoin/glycerol metabolism
MASPLWTKQTAFRMHSLAAHSRQEQHADHIRRAAGSNSRAVQSAIAASWKRSLFYYGLEPEKRFQVDRVDDLSIKQARQRLGRLIEIAGPTLDRLFGAVGRPGSCVLLTDAEGLILERRGLQADDVAFAELGLCVGADWNEAAEGTNGIGTCLAEQRSVIIHRDQHFHCRNTGLSCAGAPIFDENARLAAALDASSCRDDLTEDLTALVGTVIADAARRIESDNFRAAFPDCRIVMTPAHGYRGSALLAVDSCDLVVGATRAARQSLGLTDTSLASARPLEDILSKSQHSSNLRVAERAELQRALARTDGNISAAARDLGIGRATLYRRMKVVGLH